MVHTAEENTEKTQLDNSKLEEAIQNLRKESKNKKIITAILKESNVDFFENVLAALDDVLENGNVCLMIIEPIPIESSAKKEIIQKIEVLRKKHGQDIVYHKTPKTELEYKSTLAVGDLGIFIEEYSVCFKEMIDFACLNKSNILIEAGTSTPIKATKVNFNSKLETVETIFECLSKENPYYGENKEIISGLQSMDFISEILSKEKLPEDMQTPDYLTEEHIDIIIKTFKKAKSRAFILDYDGTLAEITKKPDMAYPRKDLKLLLKKLGNIPNCDLVICTGRTKQIMDQWFPYYKTDKNAVSSQTSNPEVDRSIFEINMTIFAEHTAARRIKNEWSYRKMDLSFLPDAYNIMKKTLEILPGSNIEVKDSGLVFHYRECEQETVDQPIQHMRASLIRSVGRIACVQTGKSIIEVNSKEISKDYCIRQYVDRKFILCAGDDTTDEDMFKIDCCSILVGNRPSNAKYRVDTPEELKQILKRIYQAAVGNNNE